MLCYTASSLFVYVIHATAACILFLTLVFARGEQAPPQPNCQQGILHNSQSILYHSDGCFNRPAENGVLRMHHVQPAATQPKRVHCGPAQKIRGVALVGQAGQRLLQMQQKQARSRAPSRHQAPCSARRAPRPGWRAWKIRIRGMPAPSVAYACAAAVGLAKPWRACRRFRGLLLQRTHMPRICCCKPAAAGGPGPTSSASTHTEAPHSRAHGPFPLAFGCGLPVATAQYQLIRICPNT